MNDLAGAFHQKSLIFDKYQTGIRAINYTTSKITNGILVKPLNAGNTITAGADGFEKDSFVFNEVINEAIYSPSGTGDFPLDNGGALRTLNSARVFSKKILQNSNQESGSLINLGHDYLQTIRNIDPISGNASVDTQYGVMRKFSATTVLSGGLTTVTLNITGNESFISADDN